MWLRGETFFKQHNLLRRLRSWVNQHNVELLQRDLSQHLRPSLSFRFDADNRPEWNPRKDKIMILNGQTYEIVEQELRVGQQRLGAQRNARREDKGLFFDRHIG